MAAGTFTIFNVAMPRLTSGEFDPAVVDFKIALLGSAQAINATFTGTSGQAVFSDLTDEVAGDGYAPGGVDMAGVTWTRLADVVTMNADAAQWTGLDVTAKYAVIYTDDSGAGLLGFVDLETSEPTGIVISDTNFTISWSTGVFTLSRAA
jgi:hypothetical protein